MIALIPGLGTSGMHFRSTWPRIATDLPIGERRGGPAGPQQSRV